MKSIRSSYEPVSHSRVVSGRREVRNEMREG
eukprot:COSAG01_NODE_54155_length_334_cov_0.651064_2_plen_30_part_01